jgi:hypothetical protein
MRRTRMLVCICNTRNVAEGEFQEHCWRCGVMGRLMTSFDGKGRITTYLSGKLERCLMHKALTRL